MKNALTFWSGGKEGVPIFRRACALALASSHKSGTSRVGRFGGGVPGVKTPGYYRTSRWDCAGNGGSFEQHESCHSLRSLEAVPPYRWRRAFKVSQDHSRLFKPTQAYSRVFGKVFFLFLWSGAPTSARRGGNGTGRRESSKPLQGYSRGRGVGGANRPEADRSRPKNARAR